MTISGVGAQGTPQVLQPPQVEKKRGVRKGIVAASATVGAIGAGVMAIPSSSENKLLGRIKGLIESNPMMDISRKKSLLKKVLKIQSKHLAVGAAIGALVLGGLSYLNEKRRVGMGRVKKVKDNPNVSQVVTTTTGKKIEIPVTLGVTTQVKALSKGRYQVTTKASLPDAKPEKTIMTEQELIEKFGSWSA